MELNKERLFSLKIDEKCIWDLSHSTEKSSDQNTETTVFTFENGIKITNILKSYDGFDAYEWVNYIENTSGENSGILSSVSDCDVTLPLKHEDNRPWTAYFPDKATATKIYAPIGSNWSSDEFYCDVDKMIGNDRIYHLYPGRSKHYTASGGRSSENNAPFFNIHKDGEGYIFAIGWSGQWCCDVARANDSVTFRSGVENAAFYLTPGEKIRTSSIVIMKYSGNVVSSQNKWRRLVKKHFSLIGKEGRDANGPLCAGIWGGMKTSSVLSRIEKIKKEGLPFEYVWMDAGWYGEDTMPSPDEFEGDWGFRTGDWRISRHIHPNALKDVAEAVHSSGMKFLLWFEPERVINSTPDAVAHPEYFLTSRYPNHPIYPNVLLNLGDEAARNHCFDTISEIIESVNLDCLRIDFNTSPLEFWLKNDEPGRAGMTEIKYINGLYTLWDAFLERFPNLIIDNCASGGRRIDIETLRRSIPLWRSDLQCPANYSSDDTQRQNMSFNTWLPYSGTGSGRLYDEYRIRSAYAAAITTNYSFSEREEFADTPEKVSFLKKYLAEYLKVRPYFSEDFYPLTESSDRLDVWCASQYHRPSCDDGVIFVFRRENSPYETASFVLSGLSSDKDYLITDADGGEITVSGDELIQKGLTLTVPEKRKAKIFFYKAI